eukprot:SAG11_NODE_18966_length_477_cov_0.592593_1_plen_41_part_10
MLPASGVTSWFRQRPQNFIVVEDAVSPAAPAQRPTQRPTEA